jgi:hypothetical protein
MEVDLPLAHGAPVTGRVATIGAGARLSDVFMGFSLTTSAGYDVTLFPVSADGSFKALLPEGSYRLFVRPMGGPYVFSASMADGTEPTKTLHSDGVTPVGPIIVAVGHPASK